MGELFENLLGPSLVLENSRGEIILSLKRKEKKDELFYLFEMHIDRVETGKLGKFIRLWEAIKKDAKENNVPLFDINEIKLKTENFKEGDVKIEVLNHATGEIWELTVGEYKE